MGYETASAARLTATRRWTVYGVGTGLWLTGLLWLIYHYFLQRHSDFGTQPHPLEFWWRAAHGFFGFASLWTVGLLWGIHVVKGWKLRRNRLSGSVLLAVLVWLIASGYLLYYVGNDEALATIALLHWAVGLALPLVFVAHRYLRRASLLWPGTGGTSHRG